MPSLFAVHMPLQCLPSFALQPQKYYGEEKRDYGEEKKGYGYKEHKHEEYKQVRHCTRSLYVCAC